MAHTPGFSPPRMRPKPAVSPRGPPPGGAGTQPARPRAAGNLALQRAHSPDMAEEAAAEAAGRRAALGPAPALPEGVRLHTDAGAAARAAALGARAFTLGDDVYFGAGRYDPGSAPGRELLAHELHHVRRQRAAGERRIERAPVDPPDPQQAKETRYGAWVRYALIGAMADGRVGVAEFSAALVKHAAPQLDAGERALFDARAAELALLSSPPWDLVNAARLVAAVSGLPKELESETPSVGTEAFLSNWVKGIARYLAAPDEAHAQERLSELIDALNGVAIRFGSVSVLLFYELNDTLMRLVELRAELAKLHEDPAARPDANLARRRAIGEELNRTARHALLVNAALGDTALTATPLDPASKTPLETQLAPLSGRLAQMRETEKTEAATQKSLGAGPALLAPAFPLGVEVAPEEAFPRTADEAAERWSADMADRADALLRDTQASRAKIVPASAPASLAAFIDVFDSWFTFLPSRAIAADPMVAAAVSGWREAAQGLGQLGIEGWMAGQLLKPVGYANYGMLALPKLWDPLAAPRLRAATGTSGVVPAYEFVHEFVPEYGAVETHAENRQVAVEQGSAGAKGGFAALWAMQQANLPVTATARSMGLAPPAATYLFLKDPAAAQGWHYLVYYESLSQDYKVAEQKAMAAPLADYLGASSQMHALLGQPHVPRSPGGAPLGEQAIRTHGIEGAEGRSQARYGLTAAPANAAVDKARRRIDDVRTRFEGDKLSSKHIIDALERSMSEALAADASAGFRVGATLYMAYREHELKDVVLKYFEPAVLAEAVAKAVAIAALLQALALLGPVGRLLSGAIGKIMAAGGGSPLGTLLALVSWILDTWHGAGSFGAARRQAFFAVDVVDVLAAFVQDKVVGGLAAKVRSWGNPARWAPKTTRDLSEALKGWLSPDQLPIAHAEIRAARERLEGQRGAHDPEVQALRALEADLGAGPAATPHLAPVPLAKPTLEARLQGAADTARQAGIDPAPLVEQARARAHAALRSAVEDGMGPLKPGETRPPVEIVSADKIGPPGSIRNAKVVIEKGKVTKILIDENASPAAVYEEGVHAAQAKDPRMRKLFAQLDPGKAWADMSPKEKLKATKAAVQIEIDAKKRIVERLEQDSSPLAQDEMIRAFKDIHNLRAKQLELAQIQPRKLGKADLPDILGEPAGLYSKKTKAGLTIDDTWSQGTLSAFKSQFEAANPGAHITLRELDSLYNKAKSAFNPNRVAPAAEKFDAPAKMGTPRELPFQTTGKRSAGDLMLTEGQRAAINSLVAARDRARRLRADALANNDDAAATRWNQEVNNASQKLGEQAAAAWSKQRAWMAGARPRRVYGGEGSRSGDFDRVDKWTDAKGTTHYLVIEAKGGESRLGGKWYKGKYVQQGSLDYFQAILDDMSRPTSSKESRDAAAELRAALAGTDLAGNKAEIHYEKVQIPVEQVSAPRTVLGTRSEAVGVEVTALIL